MERFGNAVVVIVACVLALAGIELSLRAFGDDVLAMGNQFRFYRFDEKLGWSNAPGTSGHFARSEYRHFIQINALGMRDRDPLPDNQTARRIAVLGDSFVWGIGADYGERFTEILEQALPGVDVLNYGVSGYGTTQHLVQLESVLATHPDQVILALCLSNDITEALDSFRNGYNKPFAIRGADGEVEIAGYPLVNVKALGGTLVGEDSPLRLMAVLRLLERRLVGRHPALNAPRFRPYLSIGGELYTPDDLLTPQDMMRKREAFDIEIALLRRMNDMVERRIGPGRFLVALVPTKMEAMPGEVPANERSNEMGDQLRRRIEHAGIPLVDPRGDFGPRQFWRRDGHWNAEGHRLFGEILARRLASD